MATTGKTFERTSESPRLHVGERLRILVAHREILANLVRKELKVKYAASALGAVWSLLNPLVYLAVFSFVAKVLGGSRLPVYLLSGLLAWNLFSASMGSGARARQREPREEDGVRARDPAARRSASLWSTSRCSRPS